MLMLQFHPASSQISCQSQFIFYYFTCLREVPNISKPSWDQLGHFTWYYYSITTRESQIYPRPDFSFVPGILSTGTIVCTGWEGRTPDKSLETTFISGGG
jgi:hypothetical protein